MLHEGSVNAKVYLEFLKRLLFGATRPVFVIVDGHPIYKAVMIKKYLEESNVVFKLFYLPPYSGYFKEVLSKRLTTKSLEVYANQSLARVLGEML
jgi:hypothetical protein